MPPTTANQALQLMYMHQKAVLQLDEPDYLKRRRGKRCGSGFPIWRR